MINLFVTLVARDDIWGAESDQEFIINDVEEIEWTLAQLSDQGFDVVDYCYEEI